MKSLFLKKAAIAVLITLATVAAKAQSSFPSIPSVSALKAWGIHLVSYANEQPKELVEQVDNFIKQIDAAIQKADDDFNAAVNSPAVKNAAEADKQMIDKKLQAETGKTSAELENMSEAQQKQLGDAKVEEMTGMSVEQLQALQGKSQAEIMAALQKSGTIEKVQQHNPAGMNQQQTRHMLEISTEMQNISQRITAEATKSERETAALEAKQKAMLQPGGEFAEIRDIYSKIHRLGDMLNEQQSAQLRALQARLTSLADSYYGKILPEWIAHINAKFETLKRLKPDYDRLEAIGMELNKMQGATNSVKAINRNVIDEKRYESSYLAILKAITEFTKADSL